MRVPSFLLFINPTFHERKKKIYAHASICSGIDGFAYAAIQMGWEHKFYCEIDEFCRKVLKFYYPNAKAYEDLRKTHFDEWRGKIDVLTAGFPCQPFSTAGKRKGTADDRYLWPEVLRAIDEIRPAWFVGENVVGITSMVLPGEEVTVANCTDLFGADYVQTKTTEFFLFERICQDIEAIGYELQPFIIPACSVGAPHRRDRLWILARSLSTSITPLSGKETVSNSLCFRSEKVCCDLQSQKPDGTIFNSSGTAATITNTTKERLSERFFDSRNAGAEKVKARLDLGPERSGSESIITHSNYFNGNSSGHDTSELFRKQSTSLFPVLSDWQNFPTVSALCERNDGISCELSSITFSKWRREAIKALGNSVVPQVVFQIFQAIEKADSLANQKTKP